MESKKAKLHELIAVNGNLKGQALKVTSELKNTFEKKRQHFTGTLSTRTWLDGVTPTETFNQLTIQTTVGKELEWITPFLAKGIDSGFVIDKANMVANADLVLEDGTVIATSVPATALLQLEKRVREVAELVKTIPTLDPTKGFEIDKDMGPEFYKAREIFEKSSKKMEKWVVIVPATERFPAQTQLMTSDEVVGNILKQEWSSMLTPASKAEMIERCEVLLRAVVSARSRANALEIDISNNKIGELLLNYMFKGDVPLT